MASDERSQYVQSSRGEGLRILARLIAKEILDRRAKHPQNQPTKGKGNGKGLSRTE